jgi:hypothetical protein
MGWWLYMGDSNEHFLIVLFFIEKKTQPDPKPLREQA